jgi:hypothetical protein
MKRIALVLLSSLLLHPSSFGQGALTPPGPPGPTMKTLAQIEPRTPISSLPFTITQPGSYYLTTNLTGSVGVTNGITIAASGVTLDLMGFELVGGTGSGIFVSGIVSGSRTNITVCNGTVRNWSSVGLDLVVASFSTVDRVRAVANQNGGIYVGVATVVSQCIATGNGTGTSGHGISTTDRSVVRDCIATDNRADGISVTAGCLVIGNVASGNGSAPLIGNGIRANGGGNRIEANQCRNNFNCGIAVSTANVGNMIVKNSAGGNGDENYCGNTGNNDFGPVSTQPATATSPWANFSL